MGERRERRRQGAINRLRRLAYGAMLGCSLPAAAGDSAPELHATYRRAAESAPQRWLTAGVEGLVGLAALKPADPAAPLGNNDDYGHLDFGDIAMDFDDPRAGSTLAVAVVQPTLLREGLGLDLGIPDLGSLRLNLYARRVPKGATGWDWTETPETPPVWSLGGSLELIRTGDGSRRVAFIPELTVDGDALTGSKLGFSASVRYAHWRRLGKTEAEDYAVPQLMFRWRY